jgi:hypothetical protein
MRCWNDRRPHRHGQYQSSFHTFYKKKINVLKSIQSHTILTLCCFCPVYGRRHPHRDPAVCSIHFFLFLLIQSCFVCFIVDVDVREWKQCLGDGLWSQFLRFHSSKASDETTDTRFLFDFLRVALSRSSSWSSSLEHFSSSILIPSICSLSIRFEFFLVPLEVSNVVDNGIEDRFGSPSLSSLFHSPALLHQSINESIRSSISMFNLWIIL